MDKGATSTERPGGPATRHRVFVVEDHLFMRRSIVAAIEREPALAVCGEAADVTTALAAIGSLRPDVVLTDLELRDSSGLAIVEHLRVHQPSLPVVATTMFNLGVNERRARAAGARAFVAKQEGPAALIRTLRETLGSSATAHPNSD